jgi:apolipoprotein N-acyltransferase
MKNITKKEWLFLIAYSACLMIVTIVLVCLRFYGFSLFTAIPIAFFLPIIITEVDTPKEIDKHVAKMVILIVLRYLMMIAGCLIPTLVWFNISWIHNSVSAYAILIPPTEILILYIISIVFTYMNENNSSKMIVNNKDKINTK